MSDHAEGQALWAWKVTWEDTNLHTNVIHGIVRELDETGLKLLPDGAKADPKNIIHCSAVEVADTKAAAYQKLADWLHSEFKERANTMHDLQKEICSVAAAQALVNDKITFLRRKDQKKVNGIIRSIADNIVQQYKKESD